MIRIFKIVTVCVAAWLALRLPAAAQVAGGAISGTITNESGAEVPGASVTITSSATGEHRTLVTDKDGFYSFPNLNPGNYVVTVTMAGYRTAKASALITVGAEPVVNARLQPGDSKSVVQQDEATAVQASSSATAAAVQGQ